MFLNMTWSDGKKHINMCPRDKYICHVFKLLKIADRGLPLSTCAIVNAILPFLHVIRNGNV